MHFTYPHHIKSVYTFGKLHIISGCGSLLGLSERTSKNNLVLVFISSVFFKHMLSWQNYNYAQPGVPPLMQSWNHIPVSCIKSLFILSVITQRERDVWPTYRMYVWNMWRAVPPCIEASYITHILQILLPDERSFLHFCYSHAFGSFIPREPTKWSQLLWCV